MRIKVCGITQFEQLHELYQLNVDYAGLIFYPNSKRYVEDKLDPAAVRDTAIAKAGVFVNQGIDEIKALGELYNLHAIQLHGDEPADFCRKLRIDFKVIKAIRVSNSVDLNEVINEYKDVTDYLLLDNGNSKSEYGGSGEKFDWKVLQNIPANCRFILSGGISPGDVDAIRSIDHKGLYAVDINSRFEVEPGEKNMELIKLFIRSVNG